MTNTRHGGASIAVVEQATGLSRDTLRQWERRYGFPTPERDSADERVYRVEQIERLRIIKALLDVGHLPDQLLRLAPQALQQLATNLSAPAIEASDDVQQLLALIRQHDVAGLRGALNLALSRQGLGSFVIDVLCPLEHTVSDAWRHGHIEPFEARLFGEAAQAVLRLALGRMPDAAAAAAPRVLLSTLSGENQALPLLMAKALLRLQGGMGISLGTETPLWDIVQAAAACHADIVMLAFGAAPDPQPTLAALAELRAKLPAAVALWVAGSAPVLQRRSLPGVRALSGFDAWPTALERWRTARLARRDDGALTPP